MSENQVPNQENNNSVMNSNNIDEFNLSQSVNASINSVTDSVPPIAEVKIAATSDNVLTNQELDSVNEVTASSITSNNDNGKLSNEPPQKNNASTILLVLLFIFLFTFIMGMPYISEFINNLKRDDSLSEIEEAKTEEETQENENKTSTTTSEDEKTEELVCTLENNDLGNYTLIETQKFYYNSENQVLKSAIVSQYSFTIIDETYNSLKQQCEQDSLQYLTHEGYTMACSYGEANIEISHEFELDTFTSIVDETTNIQANATYRQDLETIKTNLIAEGYICQ